MKRKASFNALEDDFRVEMSQDGEIFRQIRIANLEQDEASKVRWLAKLSEVKRNRVLSLENMAEMQ